MATTCLRTRRTLPMHGRDRMEKTVPNFRYQVSPTRNDKPYRATDVSRSATSGFVRSWTIDTQINELRVERENQVHHCVGEINLLLYGIETVLLWNKNYSFRKHVKNILKNIHGHHIY